MFRETSDADGYQNVGREPSNEEHTVQDLDDPAVQ